MRSKVFADDWAEFTAMIEVCDRLRPFSDLARERIIFNAGRTLAAEQSEKTLMDLNRELIQ